MMLGKKALPEKYHELMDIARDAPSDPKGAALKAVVCIAKKSLPPPAGDLIELAIKAKDDPAGAAMEAAQKFLPPEQAAMLK